jgi:hypothetical protein
MPDQCASVTSRSRSYSEPDTSCAPTDEERAAKEVGAQREAEREAEARRNAYFAGNTDEGGQCSRACSDASTYSPMSPEDVRLKDSLRTKRIDPPIVSDPAGNMIIAALGGGLIAGARGAAKEALFPSTAGKSVLEHAATATAKSLAKGAAKEALLGTFDTGPQVQPSKTTPAGSPTPAASPAPVGRTGAQGTSEVAPEPNMSPAPFTGPYVIRG